VACKSERKPGDVSSIEGYRVREIKLSSDFDMERMVAKRRCWKGQSADFIDPRRDTLVIGCNTMLLLHTAKGKLDTSQVQNLAYRTQNVDPDHDMDEDFEEAWYQSLFLNLKAMCPRLKNLKMVLGRVGNRMLEGPLGGTRRLTEIDSKIRVLVYNKHNNAVSMKEKMADYLEEAADLRFISRESAHKHEELLLIDFRVAVRTFEDRYDAEWYEVLDIAPVEETKDGEEKQYYAQRPMGSCQETKLYFFEFEDEEILSQRCYEGGELLGPYDGIRGLFQEKTTEELEREEEERKINTNWGLMYGGKVFRDE
jgi:hypothetical protein